MTPAIRAVIGAAAWGAFVVARVPALHDGAWGYALLLLSALVIVPFALELYRDADEPAATLRWLWWLNRVQLPAGLLLCAAFWFPPGLLAAALALPWVLLTGAMAFVGVARVKRDGLRRELDGLCRDAAMVFALVGGLWTLADRLAYRPLGFDPAIVALTAVHFHFAGLLLPLSAGLVQRELFFLRLASRAAVGVVLGVPAVAVGITETQLGWGPSLEAAAGCGLALAGMVVGILQVRIALEGKQSRAAQVLLAIAGGSLFCGMVLAAFYAMRSIAAPIPWLGIPQMRMLHGTINAVGFGLCGVLGWRQFVAR